MYILIQITEAELLYFTQSIMYYLSYSLKYITWVIIQFARITAQLISRGNMQIRYGLYTAYIIHMAIGQRKLKILDRYTAQRPYIEHTVNLLSTYGQHNAMYSLELFSIILADIRRTYGHDISPKYGHYMAWWPYVEHMTIILPKYDQYKALSRL